MIKKSKTEDTGPVEYTERLRFCADIIETGARPVIAAHISGVTRKDAINLYVDIHGERPSRGMLPSSSGWFFNTKDRVVQATAFLEIFLKLSEDRSNRNDDNNVDRTIYDAYRIFSSIANDDSRREVMEFDRGWTLIMSYRAKEVFLHTCKCGSKTLALAGTPKSLIDCVGCS